MPISSSDIKYKYSVKTGAAGNTTAGTAAGSLGKYISTTEITTGTLNNLFDDVTAAENAALDVEYRCIFVHNSHATITLTDAVVWVKEEVAGGCGVAIAVDNIAASAIGSADAQADDVADESTAPDGVGGFSTPASKAAGLALGDIAAGYCRAVWIRRTATNSAAMNNDGATIRVEGNTVT
ncbi:MAG: hypothetical protein ABFE07_02805 [Armatimonadia bacterium]